MPWTNEPPDKPGWYWYRYEADADVMLIGEVIRWRLRLRLSETGLHDIYHEAVGQRTELEWYIQPPATKPQPLEEPEA